MHVTLYGSFLWNVIILNLTTNFAFLKKVVRMADSISDNIFHNLMESDWGFTLMCSSICFIQSEGCYCCSLSLSLHWISTNKLPAKQDICFCQESRGLLHFFGGWIKSSPSMDFREKQTNKDGGGGYLVIPKMTKYLFKIQFNLKLLITS